MTETPGTALERPVEILNPISGELVAVTDLPAVALAVEEIKEAKSQLDGVLAQFAEAAAAYAQVDGRRTFDAGRYRLVVGSDSDIEWDIPALQDALVEAGCPQARIDALIKAKVSYSVDGSVRRQLETNDGYKAAIATAMTRVPKRASLKVETRR